MTYDHNITITVPKEQAAVARKIGIALDPDAGGADSFRPVVIGYTDDKMPQPIYGDNISVSTPCTHEFCEQVPMMLADPALLHDLVCADYAKRWPDEVPPTLEECVAFCKAVVPEPVADVASMALTNT